MTTTGSEATGTGEHTAPREAWDVIAEGYDRYVAPQAVDLANEALRLVGLEPGDRFLDVAAGTGGLSLPAARLGAKVLATDWSPAMIERFEACAREEGLSTTEGRVMDCHALDLPDDPGRQRVADFAFQRHREVARADVDPVQALHGGDLVEILQGRLGFDHCPRQHGLVRRHDLKVPTHKNTTGDKHT